MEITGILNVIFRWLHVIAGIVWIGHLYFFNFVNIPFGAKMKEAGVSKTVVPELMPRALYWFRWGAAWTWITGVLLLLLVYYHGGLLREGEDQTLNAAAFVCLAIALGGFIAYDLLYQSPLGANGKNARIVATLLVVVALLTFVYYGEFSYRAYNIHIGALFGTAMAYNVWFRIWPAQQKIIAAVKGGQPPDAALLTLAGTRSRHNTYLSVPLVWMMLNEHTAKTQFSSWQWIGLLVMIFLGWHIVFQFYKKSTKVQGF